MSVSTSSVSTATFLGYLTARAPTVLAASSNLPSAMSTQYCAIAAASATGMAADGTVGICSCDWEDTGFSSTHRPMAANAAARPTRILVVMTVIATVSLFTTSGLSTLIQHRLPGGASRLAALLVVHISPICSLLAPCD